MIQCIKLSTSKGDFFGHLYQGYSQHLFVVIPGLMEPKAGLYYIWQEVARAFHNKGHSCILFDLAGQGDSTLPFSFDLWFEQRDAIYCFFKNMQIHMISRGIGSILLSPQQLNFAIMPSLCDPVSKQLKDVRWKRSLFCKENLTLEHPHNLISIEIKCLHNLGAEAECIGCLEIPAIWIDALPGLLPKKLPKRTYCYYAEKGHPLFNKKEERDNLIKIIDTDFNNMILGRDLKSHKTIQDLT